MLSENATLNYVSAVLQEKNVPEKFSPVMTGILSRSYFNQDAGCMEIVTNTYVKKEIARKMGLKSPGLVGSGINNLTDAGFLCVWRAAFTGCLRKYSENGHGERCSPSA